MSVQANNIYVGARYIPRIMGEYNNETAYEALDIVTSGGVGYISRQPVPAGTAVTNKEYWAMWGSGNAAIDALTQRVATNETDITALETGLQQTNQKLQNLVIPWEPASTLKGDGSTDNTAGFGQLDANTPVSLMPGSYLISGNVTIPCAVQFLPGAKLVYNAATPGTNYCTVTFSKGFVEYGTQIFDTYIIPRVGSQNATPEINPAWYGVAENQTAKNNDLALTWILSSVMNAKTVNFAPGVYTFSNISTGTYFNAQAGATINGNGATFSGNIVVPQVTFQGAVFTGNVSANRGTFISCTFNGGSISSSYGVLTIINCNFEWSSGICVSTMGTNGQTIIKDCVINRNVPNLTSPFSLSDSNINTISDCTFNDLGSESTMPHFSIQLGQSANNRVIGCYMPSGSIVCAYATNNTCYSLSATTNFNNVVNGQYQAGNLNSQMSGFNASLATLLTRDYPYDNYENDNFRVIRFNDGLMIATFQLPLTNISISTAIGQLFRTNADPFDQTWTWPTAFTKRPYYFGVNLYSTNNQGCWAYIDESEDNILTQVPRVQLIAPTSRTVSGYLEFVAIGDWKTSPLG